MLHLQGNLRFVECFFNSIIVIFQLYHIQNATIQPAAIRKSSFLMLRSTNVCQSRLKPSTLSTSFSTPMVLVSKIYLFFQNILQGNGFFFFLVHTLRFLCIFGNVPDLASKERTYLFSDCSIVITAEWTSGKKHSTHNNRKV